MHGLGDGEYRATGESRELLIPEAAGIYRFRVHLPIGKRDLIAVEFPGSFWSTVSRPSTARARIWKPAPPLSTVTSPTHYGGDLEMLWNATVRSRRGVPRSIVVNHDDRT